MANAPAPAANKSPPPKNQNSKTPSQNQKNSNASPNAKTNSSGNKSPVGRPHETHPFRTFHTLAAGETRNSPYTNPNIIFFAGGALLVAADIKRIGNVFKYAWGNKNTKGGYNSPVDFWQGIKVILMQLLFLFVLTMSARVIPPLGRVWLIVIMGMWILFLMKNPQVLQLLQWNNK